MFLEGRRVTSYKRPQRRLYILCQITLHPIRTEECAKVRSGRTYDILENTHDVDFWHLPLLREIIICKEIPA